MMSKFRKVDMYGDTYIAADGISWKADDIHIKLFDRLSLEEKNALKWKQGYLGQLEEIASLKQHNKELYLEIEIRDGMINDLQCQLESKEKDSIPKDKLLKWVNGVKQESETKHAMNVIICKELCDDLLSFIESM